MRWLIGSQNIYLDFVASWLRSQVAELSRALMMIEETHDYHNDSINESLRTVESELRRIRKFIEAN